MGATSPVAYTSSSTIRPRFDSTASLASMPAHVECREAERDRLIAEDPRYADVLDG